MKYVLLFLFAAYIIYRLFIRPGIRTRKREGFFVNFPNEMVSGSVLEDYYRGIRIIKTIQRDEHDYKVFGETTYKGFLNRKPHTTIIFFNGKHDYEKNVFDDHRNISKTYRIINGNEEKRKEYEYSYNSSTGKYDKTVEFSFKNGLLNHKIFYENNNMKRMVWYDENGNEKKSSNFND